MLMLWPPQQPLQRYHPRQNRKYWLLAKICIIQNMLWISIRLSNKLRRPKQSMRHHQVWSLEIGNSLSWISYSMVSSLKIPKKPLPIDKGQASSSTMCSSNNCTEDQMMESCFGVCPTKKHKLRFTKPMTACVVLTNLAPNSSKNGLLQAKDNHQCYSLCKKMLHMPNQC